MVRRRRRESEIRVRLYPGMDPDSRLIEWIEQFEDRPYGDKSKAIKEALLRGIDGGGETATTRANLDAETLREAIAAILADIIPDLSEIRQVVEVGVLSALSQSGSRLGAVSAGSIEEDDETEALLDALADELVITSDELEEGDHG
jgi:hypothetical protein